MGIDGCAKVLLFSIIFSSCATQKRGPEFRADLSLVRPYSFELENEKPLPAPYVATFSKNGKKLFFVASEHLSLKRYPNALEAPILRTISKLFSEEHPQVVIVEGLNTAEEISPKSMIAPSDKCEASRYANGCGEPIFAINQARKSTADYITGEPVEATILKEALNSGYSTEDVLGYYLVRQIPQFKRQNNFSMSSFSKQVDHYLKSFRRDLGVDLQFGFSEFRNWYSLRMPKPRDFLDIENDDTAPDAGPGATYIQRISHTVSLSRDRAVVKTIERMLNRYDRVLVVYGGSHLITEEPALKAMLGSPLYAKPF